MATQPLDLKRAFVDEKPVAELGESCGCQMLLWLVLSRQEQTLDLSGVLLPFAVKMSLDIHFYLKSGEFITDVCGRIPRLSCKHSEGGRSMTQLLPCNG